MASPSVRWIVPWPDRNTPCSRSECGAYDLYCLRVDQGETSSVTVVDASTLLCRTSSTTRSWLLLEGSDTFFSQADGVACSRHSTLVRGTQAVNGKQASQATHPQHQHNLAFQHIISRCGGVSLATMQSQHTTAPSIQRLVEDFVYNPGMMYDRRTGQLVTQDAGIFVGGHVEESGSMRCRGESLLSPMAFMEAVCRGAALRRVPGCPFAHATHPNILICIGICRKSELWERAALHVTDGCSSLSSSASAPRYIDCVVSSPLWGSAAADAADHSVPPSRRKDVARRFINKDVQPVVMEARVLRRHADDELAHPPHLIPRPAHDAVTPSATSLVGLPPVHSDEHDKHRSTTSRFSKKTPDKSSNSNSLG